MSTTNATVPSPTDAPTPTWERVTPAQAVAWLTQNHGNRRPKPTAIAHYARQMAEGLWRDDNPDPVIFDTAGNLINGQHRLEAIVNSGREATMLILRGVDATLRDVLDTGTRRTASDLLQITHGLAPSRAARYAAAIRALSAWERVPHRGPEEYASTSLSNQEVLLLLPRYEPTLERLVPLAAAITTARLPSGDGLWLALLVRFDELDSAAAERFADLIATGANLPARSPILTLRERLLRGRGATAVPPHRLIVARLIVYAWNAWRQGRRLSKLIALPSHGEAADVFPTPL